MDKYTEKYFYNEIKQILNEAKDVEKLMPIFVYKLSQNEVRILHWSGNKIDAIDPEGMIGRIYWPQDYTEQT